MTELRWNQLQALALSGTASELRAQFCPTCDGGIRIRYSSAGRGWVQIACLRCPSRINLDGISKEPPWVSEVGDVLEVAARAT